MLGFHHSASLQYPDGSVSFDGVVYDNAEQYDDGLYESESSLASPHSDAHLTGPDASFGLFEQYVKIIYCIFHLFREERDEIYGEEGVKHSKFGSFFRSQKKKKGKKVQKKKAHESPATPTCPLFGL
jgi:hypothetical protein